MARSMSPYDDAVPHPGRDAGLAARFAALRDARPAADLDAVGDLALLVSSSRGGSSMLTEILRQVHGLLALPGEVNPHVVVAQLTGADADVFRAELARDIGRPATPREVDLDVLTADVHWRLTAQWPAIDIDAAAVRAAVESAARAAGTDDVRAFTRAVLADVSARHPAVTPASYDIGRTTQTPPPPTAPVVEMTPYVGFRPWRTASEPELRSMPLVIGTPRNSFRVEWLLDLFPSARVRLLHLTRNPAAAVNGLIDGWRSPSFFTTPVDTELSAGGRWWKYDVPPGWRALAAAPLPQIAAAQWRSAHAAVLDVVARTGIEVLRVRYEDLVGAPEQREETAEALAAWVGIEPTAMRAAVLRGVPPVMATAPPQRRRWSASDNDLAPALADPEVWEVAARLGYDVEERLWI